MTHLLILICIPYIAFWFKSTKYALYLTHYTKHTWTKGKPFNCAFCLGCWFGLATDWLLISPWSAQWPIYPIIALTCGVFAYLIEYNYYHKP